MLLHELLLLLGLFLLSLQEHQLVRSQLADVSLLGCFLKHLSIVIKLCPDELLNVENVLLGLLHGIGLSQFVESGYELYDLGLLGRQDVDWHLLHAWLLKLQWLLVLMAYELLLAVA